MEYITTTNLRTQSSELVNTLKRGDEVSLIHRSKLVGIIRPVQQAKKFDVAAFKELISGLDLPPTTYAEREKIYRKHLMEKYGKGISRH